MSIRFAHVINPVQVSKASDLNVAQPVTFESMIKAKVFSAQRHEISLYSISFEEDKNLSPPDFKNLPPLRRSVLDVGAFNRKRKLPLIEDILMPLSGYEDLDYVIYTNVDIALMPYFYNYIVAKIKSGSDSLIINRRVINIGLSDLSELYAQMGKSHPGYDCFVFRRELLQKFVLGNTCIGANWIGRVMIANLIMFSKSLEIIKDCHLTFHIGDDGAWLNNDYSEFDIHNKNEAYRIIHQFLETPIDEKKKNELEEIIQFMDAWGIQEIPTTQKSGRSLLLWKIKYKLREFLS